MSASGKRKLDPDACLATEQGQQAEQPLVSVKRETGAHRAPTSLAELFQWPFSVYEALDFDEQSRLQSNLEGGFGVFTQFSGMATPEQALLMIEHLLLPRLHLQKRRIFKSMEQCDHNEQCRRVLQGLSSQAVAEHIFGDVLDRLPLVARQELRLQQGILDAKDTTAAQKEHALTAIKNILERTDMLSEAYCYRHGRLCPMWPVPATAKAASQRLHITGTPCVDWSTMGKRAGVMGSTSLAFHTWLREMQTRLPGLLIHECTPKFQPHLLKDAMNSNTEGYEYECESVLLSPSMFGVPTSRLRRFTVLCRSDLWTLAKPLRDILKLTLDGGSECPPSPLDGHIFFAAPEHMVQEELDARALETLGGSSDLGRVTFED